MSWESYLEEQLIQPISRRRLFTHLTFPGFKVVGEILHFRFFTLIVEIRKHVGIGQLKTWH